MKKYELSLWAALFFAGFLAIATSFPIIVKHQKVFAGKEFEISERTTIFERIFTND